MAGNITPYTSLITSEHANQPNFGAALAAAVQPFADQLSLAQAIPLLYDVDTAIGEQLDVVGQWIGVTRYLQVSLPNVYFSFDTTGLGFDQGTWQGPIDPSAGLVTLPDDTYRILLYATIAADHWNGTVPQLYTIWNAIFSPLGFQILVIDNQDMTMSILLVGGSPNAVTIQLLKNGELIPRPAGVGINGYYSGTAPVFFLDVVATPLVAGLDLGNWAIPL